MSLSLLFRKTVLFAGLTAAIPLGLVAQTSFVRNGGEYSQAGAIVGDQVHPQVAIKSSGGYVVWDDNYTDGDGQGVSALRLDGSFSGYLSPFRVNSISTGSQERPQLSLLNGGGAAFVWQGGSANLKHIYARFLSPANTWLANDTLVNAVTNKSQGNPVIATLTGGNVVVAYGSYNQFSSNSLQDVYAQTLSATGQKLGGEFLVNQFTTYNQRTPAVAALSDGRFVIAWVSEQERFENSVDIYARLFKSDGTSAGNEFIVSSSTNICANPSIAASLDGGFKIVWSERDLANSTNSWDVYGRAYSGTALAGPTSRLNQFLFGDQFAPRLAAIGSDVLVIWTSLSQDGSGQGVFGRFLRSDLSPAGNEFVVTSTTAGDQKYPCVAGDGQGRFLATWSSFTGISYGFDLFAQRFASQAQVLSALAAPFVTVLSSNALSVSWPVMGGLSVASYEVYADGAVTATAVVTNTWWTMTNLAPNSAHTFRVDYVLADGRRSPLSASSSATTYGTLAWGGIPYDWMIQYFGNDAFGWPSPYADSDGDGVSNLNEFMAGTVPTNASSVLKITLQSTKQGLYLNWNTQPGLIYQVQTSSNMSTWANLSGPRFSAGANDSIYVGGANKSYYRIVRLR